MRTLKLLPILGCVMMLNMASTCHNDDDDSSSNSNSNASIAAVTNTALQGNWRITYYFDTDHDDTAKFANYTFTFGSGGVLTATGNDNTYIGNWSITDSHNGNDDSGHSSDDVDFNISFASPASFTELSDDWDIVTYSNSRIELIDISGGNGGTDHLILEKN